MSIRSIDTQIMITRATDFIREASSMQRQPVISQELLAAQAKVDNAQDQSRVAATIEADMENIRTDTEEEGSGNTGEESSNPEEEEIPEDFEPELLVAPAAHDQIIDITI